MKNKVGQKFVKMGNGQKFVKIVLLICEKKWVESGFWSKKWVKWPKIFFAKTQYLCGFEALFGQKPNFFNKIL